MIIGKKHDDDDDDNIGKWVVLTVPFHTMIMICNGDHDDDHGDDDDDNIGEWVVLTVPLSQQLQFLMQAAGARC